MISFSQRMEYKRPNHWISAAESRKLVMISVPNQAQVAINFLKNTANAVFQQSEHESLQKVRFHTLLVRPYAVSDLTKYKGDLVQFVSVAMCVLIHGNSSNDWTSSCLLNIAFNDTRPYYAAEYRQAFETLLYRMIDEFALEWE